MIWAQKHFAYAHNIRYVMLCYVTYVYNLSGSYVMSSVTWPFDYSPYAISYSQLQLQLQLMG